MAALPTSLALTSILDGSAIIAADHRNNYSAVQTAVNGLITDFSGGGAGQVLTSLSASSIGYVSGVVADGNGVTLSQFLTLTPGANLDITSAAITPTASFHTLTTSGGTSLTTINSTANGRLLVLINGTGGAITIAVSSNINTTTGAGVGLANTHATALIYNTATSKWVQIV